jgi:nucleoside-diphosphate-sugar epimerase
LRGRAATCRDAIVMFMGGVILSRDAQIATVLVTGCSGFLGRHCLAELVRQGYCVHAVSRFKIDTADKGTVWHTVDLSSKDAVRQLIATLRPTHLLHLAWITTPELYRFAPENLDWLEASIALVRAFGEHGGQRLVGVGSATEYGASDAPCREDETPIRPVTPYGRCKSALWMATEACAQRYGFSAAWSRVFVPYGPGDPLQRLIPSLIAAFGAGQQISVTDGRQIRDFIYAPDVAALLVRLLQEQDATGAFNVGTGRGVSVRQVIELLADLYNARGLVRLGTRPQREDEPLSLVADMSKVRRVLDWSAPTSIEDGLERLTRTSATSPLARSNERTTGSCAS